MMEEFGDPVVGPRERLLNLACRLVEKAMEHGPVLDGFDAGVLAKDIATVHEALLVRMKGGEGGADL